MVLRYMYLMYCTRKQYFRNAIPDLNVRGLKGALIRGALIRGTLFRRGAYLRGALNRRFTVGYIYIYIYIYYFCPAFCKTTFYTFMRSTN